MRLLIASLVCLATTACQADNQGYDCECRALTDYKVSPDETTLDGIRIDSSGNREIDFDLLDSIVADLESCLGVWIDRSGFEVKVPEDWYLSPCTGAELFPCNLPPSLCEGVGLHPTAECPCACAGAVQPQSTVVVTPNLAALSHELIHLITGARHGDDEFLRCED